MAAIRLSGGALRELRIHLCQKSAASSGTREFIEQNYVGIKKANPKFPILVRECSGIAPRVWARYDHGREMQVSLENKSSADVLNTIRQLAVEK